MSLEIKPDDINRFVADAIVKSALGDAVRKQIDAALANLNSSWDNPLKKMIETEVAQIVARTIRETYGEQLKARIADKVAEQVADEIIDKIVNAAMARY